MIDFSSENRRPSRFGATRNDDSIKSVSLRLEGLTMTWGFVGMDLSRLAYEINKLNKKKYRAWHS